MWRPSLSTMEMWSRANCLASAHGCIGYFRLFLWGNLLKKAPPNYWLLRLSIGTRFSSTGKSEEKKKNTNRKRWRKRIHTRVKYICVCHIAVGLVSKLSVPPLSGLVKAYLPVFRPCDVKMGCVQHKATYGKAMIHGH